MSIHGEQTLPSATRRVMEAMGRSLTIYQQIERQLKFLLPHLVGPHQKTGGPFADWKNALDSKTTLGPLVECLKNSIQSTHPEGLSHYLAKVVDHRNELVHHFYDLPCSRMSSIQDCNDALAHLDARFRFALALHQMIREVLRQFSLALEKSILDDGAIQDG